MANKSTASVLHEVDPALKIISGRRRKRDWDSCLGVACDGCGDEMLRFFRLCPHCMAKFRGITPERLDTTDEMMQKMFPEEEWELVDIYRFKKRTTYIYQHRFTGKKVAHNIMKEEEWKKQSTPSTASNSPQAT